MHVIVLKDVNVNFGTASQKDGDVKVNTTVVLHMVRSGWFRFGFDGLAGLFVVGPDRQNEVGQFHPA